MLLGYRLVGSRRRHTLEHFHHLGHEGGFGAGHAAIGGQGFDRVVPLVAKAIGDRLRGFVQRLHLGGRVALEDDVTAEVADAIDRMGHNDLAWVVAISSVVGIQQDRNLVQLPHCAACLACGFLVFPFAPGAVGEFEHVEVVGVG